MLFPFLFDQYRQFYLQESDLGSGRDFLEKRMVNNESVIYVAEQNNALVGFVQLYPCFSSVSMERMDLLNDLYVMPVYRQRGIAAALLLEVQAFAKKTKKKGLLLQTGKEKSRTETV